MLRDVYMSIENEFADNYDMLSKQADPDATWAIFSGLLCLQKISNLFLHNCRVNGNHGKQHLKHRWVYWRNKQNYWSLCTHAPLRTHPCFIENSFSQWAQPHTTASIGTPLRFPFSHHCARQKTSPRRCEWRSAIMIFPGFCFFELAHSRCHTWTANRSVFLWVLVLKPYYAWNCCLLGFVYF